MHAYQHLMGLDDRLVDVAELDVSAVPVVDDRLHSALLSVGRPGRERRRVEAVRRAAQGHCEGPARPG